MVSRKAKLSRTMRGKARLIEITARDKAALILIGLTKYLSIEQLSRDLFPNPDRCRRRIRDLYNANYVSVTLLSSTKPNIISLTRKGLNFTLSRYPDLVGELRLAGSLRLAGIEHHLAVVDVRLYCSALGELRRAPLTRWSNAGGKLHRELGLLDHHLSPDGLAEWSTSQGSLVIAIEADLSHETLTTLRKKLERYALIADQEQLDAVWFVVKGGRERQANIERLIREVGLSDWMRVLPHDHVVARPVKELPERGAVKEGVVKTLIPVTQEPSFPVGESYV